MVGSEHLVVVRRAILEDKSVHAILLDGCDGEWWYTKEGWFLLVEPALQVGHELHGRCSLVLILLSGRSLPKMASQRQLCSSECSCFRSHAVGDAKGPILGNAPRAEVARSWHFSSPEQCLEYHPANLPLILLHALDDLCALSRGLDGSKYG